MPKPFSLSLSTSACAIPYPKAIAINYTVESMSTMMIFRVESCRSERSGERLFQTRTGAAPNTTLSLKRGGSKQGG